MIEGAQAIGSDLAGIPLEALGIGSGWMLVCLFVLGIMRGWLVPKRFYDDLAHDRDEAIASSRIKDVQITKKDEQLEHVVEVGLLMRQVLSAVQRLNDDEVAP